MQSRTTDALPSLSTVSIPYSRSCWGRRTFKIGEDSGVTGCSDVPSPSTSPYSYSIEEARSQLFYDQWSSGRIRRERPAPQSRRDG